MSSLSIPRLILRLFGLANRWLNLLQANFDITTRQRIQSKWEANNYDSDGGLRRSSSSRFGGAKLGGSRLSYIDPHSRRLWRAAYYLYLVIAAGRCLVFVYVVQTGHISLDEYRDLDPLLVITLNYFAGHHSFALCLVLLVILFLHLDYRTNVRLLPVTLARPLYELMVENYGQFWRLNAPLFGARALSPDGSPVRRRQSILQQAESLRRIWRSAHETRFHTPRLTCFPNLSARTRARAAIILTLFDKLEMIGSLAILALFVILMLSHANFIISTLMSSSSRAFAWTLPLQILSITVEIVALNFTYLHSMRQATFVVETAGFWILVATFHLLECIIRLMIVRVRTRPNHGSQMKLVQNLASFQSEHTVLSRQLAQLNRCLVSPSLAWAAFAFVPITIYMVTVLYFLSPPPLARLIYCVGIVLLAGSYLFLVSGPMLYMMDVMYRPARLLSGLQVRLGGRFVTYPKMKLATYHELINTRNRAPVCFTMGAVSPLTQWWSLEFALLFTSMMMYAFKVFIKTKHM